MREFINDGFDAPVKLHQRVWIFFAVIVLLCNYYYLYFVDFQQGNVGAGVVFSLLKLVGVALVSSVFLRSAICITVSLEALLLLLFLSVAVLIYILKTVSSGLGDVMFFNGVMCLAPFLLLESKPNLGRARVFFESCMAVVAVQIFVDFVIYVRGYSIWENKAFIGGLGNPSSFGLVCNILICYVLFKRKCSMSSVFFYLVFSCGVYMTSSMLAFLMLLFVSVLWLLGKASVSRLAFGGGAMVLLLLLGQGLMSDHLEYKLRSIAVILDGGSGDQSASVSIRVQNNIEYAANFHDDPVAAVFYGFTQIPYFKYDSQVLAYVSSFGIVVSFVFFLAVFFIYIRLRFEVGLYFLSIIVFLFGVTFLTNRIMDYYPLPIFISVIFYVFRESSKSKRALVVKEGGGIFSG